MNNITRSYIAQQIKLDLFSSFDRALLEAQRVATHDEDGNEVDSEDVRFAVAVKSFSYIMAACEETAANHKVYRSIYLDFIAELAALGFLAVLYVDIGEILVTSESTIDGLLAEYELEVNEDGVTATGYGDSVDEDEDEDEDDEEGAEEYEEDEEEDDDEEEEEFDDYDEEFNDQRFS